MVRKAPSTRGLFLDNTDTADLYWSDLAGRHSEHRRRSIKLTIAVVALSVAAIFLGPLVAAPAVALGIALAFELWMLRRSR
jgi:hypothetical protein